MELETEICFSNAVRARSVAVGSTPLSVTDVLLCYLRTPGQGCRPWLTPLRGFGFAGLELSGQTLRALPMAPTSPHQDHRTVRAGRDLWRSPITKAGWHGARDTGERVQVALGGLQKGGSTHSLGSVKKFFLTLRWNFLHCNLWTLLLILKGPCTSILAP